MKIYNIKTATRFYSNCNESGCYGNVNYCINPAFNSRLIARILFLSKSLKIYGKY